MARIAELGEAPAFLGASEVTALIVNANRLGLTGKVALRECRRISPSTAVVVVATTRPTHGLKDALEGGATAFISWPAAPEVLRRALHSGRQNERPVFPPGPDRARRCLVDEPRSADETGDLSCAAPTASGCCATPTGRRGRERHEPRTQPSSSTRITHAAKPGDCITPRPASWPRPRRRRPARSPPWSSSPSWTPNSWTARSSAACSPK